MRFSLAELSHTFRKISNINLFFTVAGRINLLQNRGGFKHTDRNRTILQSIFRIR